MKTVVLPIIIIAIIGIGALLMFELTKNPLKPNINLTIEGLKDKYNVGEQFRFYVKATGYGKLCGDPYIIISSATNRSKIIWSYTGNESLGICPTRDIQDTFGTGLISINQTGSYLVQVLRGDKTSEKQILVSKSSKWPVIIDQLFVAPVGDEFNPINGALKAGQTYSVTCEITRLEAIQGNYTQYALLIQIQNSTGVSQGASWQFGMLPVGQKAEGGIYWTPKVSGNYTISSFVWRELTGTPQSDPLYLNVIVN